MTNGLVQRMTVEETTSIQWVANLDWELVLGHYANSADPIQMPQNVASDQGLHNLLTGISVQNRIKMKTSSRNPKARNGFVPTIRMDKFTYQKLKGLKNKQKKKQAV